MQLTFALPYRMKFADRIGMLTQEERDAIDDRVLKALADAGIDRRAPEAAEHSRQSRAAALEDLGLTLRARVTTLLVAHAVRAAYGDRMVRKDQKAWARIQDAADEAPNPDLGLKDALWLTGLFFTDKGEPVAKVWDSYPPDWARWLDVLEAELTQVVEKLRDPKGEPPKE